MRTKLILKREAITDLSPGDMHSIVGAHVTTSCSCLCDLTNTCTCGATGDCTQETVTCTAITDTCTSRFVC